MSSDVGTIPEHRKEMQEIREQKAEFLSRVSPLFSILLRLEDLSPSSCGTCPCSRWNLWVGLSSWSLSPPTVEYISLPHQVISVPVPAASFSFQNVTSPTLFPCCWVLEEVSGVSCCISQAACVWAGVIGNQEGELQYRRIQTHSQPVLNSIWIEHTLLPLSLQTA